MATGNDQIYYQEGTEGHDVHEEEHHHSNFITTYIFSTDHKMIAKQYLFTGIMWAFIGGLFSIIFRLQLGFPGMDMSFLKPILGGWINETGNLDPTFYSGAGNHARYDHGILRAHSRAERYV